MLTLAVTFLAALYLLGPDLLSRSIISFVAPRKGAPTNRGEEVTRAVLWAAVPLSVSILWCWSRGILLQWGRWSAVDNVFICFSGSCTAADRTNLPASLRGVLGMNLSLLWREYLLVILGATSFAIFIRNYGGIWRRAASHPKWRAMLLWLINSQVADWHVWLSDMLLPQRDLTVVADVLTKNGTLYQGIVDDKTLASDGTLQALTLRSPRRYLREEFHDALAANPDVTRESFWHTIPSGIFVVLGSDMVNLNIHYVSSVTKPPVSEPTSAQKELLRSITTQASSQQTVPSPPSAQPPDWHPTGDENR
jgi:hypothetical protein